MKQDHKGKTEEVDQTKPIKYAASERNIRRKEIKRLAQHRNK